MLLIAIFAYGSMALAQRPHRCLKAAQEHGFHVYKGECGGYGEIQDCSIEPTSQVFNQRFKALISCGYAGEPDYNDSMEMEVLIDSKSCRILNSKMNECFTN